MMQKEHWQAATFAMAALCVMAMAAAFYNRAELRRVTELLRQAEAATPHAATEQREIIYTPDPMQPQPMQMPMPAQYAQPTTTPQANRRCVGGVIIEKVGNELRSGGRC